MRCRVGAGDVGGAREQAVQVGEGRVDRLAEFGHQPARQRARRGHGDLLAEDDARGRLEAVHRPRHAQPGARRHRQRRQARVDQRRVGVQVQRMAQPLHQRAHRRQQRRRHAQVQLRGAAARSGTAASRAALPLMHASAACGAAPGRRPPRRRAWRAAPGSPARRRCRRAAGRPGAGWARGCRAFAPRQPPARRAACLRSALGFMR